MSASAMEKIFTLSRSVGDLAERRAEGAPVEEGV
jgi:hypothetical protein